MQICMFWHKINQIFVSKGRERAKLKEDTAFCILSLYKDFCVGCVLLYFGLSGRFRWNDAPLTKKMERVSLWQLHPRGSRFLVAYACQMHEMWSDHNVHLSHPSIATKQANNSHYSVCVCVHSWANRTGREEGNWQYPKCSQNSVCLPAWRCLLGSRRRRWSNIEQANWINRRLEFPSRPGLQVPSFPLFFNGMFQVLLRGKFCNHTGLVVSLWAWMNRPRLGPFLTVHCRIYPARILLVAIKWSHHCMDQ